MNQVESNKWNEINSSINFVYKVYKKVLSK